LSTLIKIPESKNKTRRNHSFRRDIDRLTTDTESRENQEIQSGAESEPLIQMEPNPQQDVFALSSTNSSAMQMAPLVTNEPTMDVEEDMDEEESSEDPELTDKGPEGSLPSVPPEDEEENRSGNGQGSGRYTSQTDSTDNAKDLENDRDQPMEETPDIATLTETTQESVAAVRPSTEEDKMATDRSTSKQVQPVSTEAGKEAEQLSADGEPAETSAEGAPEEGEDVQKTLETGSSEAMMRSLTSMSATDFVNGMKAASAAAAGLQEEEKKQQQESLPEIDQPTGIQTKTQKKAEETKLKKEGAPDLEAKGNEEGKQVETEHKQAEGPVPGANVSGFREPEGGDEEDSGSWWSRLFSRIKAYLRSLPDSDSGVNTSAGKRPKVDLSGKADPEQNKEHKTKTDSTVDKNRVDAQKETTRDFGEYNIYPDIETGTLSPSTEITGAGPREKKPLGARQLDPDVEAALNANLQSKMNEEVKPKNQEFAEAHQQYETDSKKEKEEGLAKIEDETERVKAEQEGQQAEAATQVDDERKKWREENEKVKEAYEQQSDEKKKEIDEKIEQEVTSAEEKADVKLDEAEKKAEAEKTKAEEKARKKKQEAENKPRGFWSRVKGAVSNVFDKVRGAINAIFDGLRKLVKGIIEAAKKLVKGIIELARRAVVGLIKAFGEALKKFVSIALAAFPELAEKARNAIDKAVNKAVETVNKAAQALKDFADKVLDAIGAALDFILSVYQKIYNAILDALEFIVIGLIEIIEGIANLVAAAKESPDHFWDAIFEELTGTDASKPLAAIERTEQPDSKKQAEGLAKTGAYSAIDEALLKKERLTSSDFNIEPVQEISLSPELDIQIAQGDAEEIEFGGAGDDSISLQDLQTSSNPQSETSNTGNVNNGGDTPGFESMTDEEKLQYYLDQMNPSCDDTSKEGEGGSSESIPDVAMVGPLTSSQRKEYILKQMKKGISNWWECNKVTIISVLAGVLLGGAILTVVTGGAFLSALPLIMKALMVIFLAELVYRMGAHLKDYLSKAWNGDITGGGISLAKAFAVGAVELIFNGIFKAGGKLLKAIKNAGKRMAKSMGKVARQAAKTTAKATKATGRAIKNVVVKGGKYTFTGLKKGIAKGARTLDDLNNRLLARFKFRKFKIKRKGKRFQLLGYINPWVLLANGEVKYTEGPETRVVGKKMKVPDGREGIVIGAKGRKVSDASLITKFMRRNPEMAKEMSGLLNRLGDDALRAKAIRGITNYRHARGRYKDALEVLNEASKRNVKGLDKLLTDLAQGGTKAKGAGWVIRHLYRNKHLLKNLDEFEQFVRIGMKGDRRFYDAVIAGVKYEFKNWEKISGIFRESLVKQIYRDLRSGAKFKWIWSRRIGSRTALERQIKEIVSDEKLMREFGYNIRDIKFIKRNLDKFFKNMEVL
jgi:hypothetical protein